MWAECARGFATHLDSGGYGGFATHFASHPLCHTLRVECLALHTPRRDETRPRHVPVQDTSETRPRPRHVRDTSPSKTRPRHVPVRDTSPSARHVQASQLTTSPSLSLSWPAPSRIGSKPEVSETALISGLQAHTGS